MNRENEYNLEDILAEYSSTEKKTPAKTGSPVQTKGADGKPHEKAAPAARSANRVQNAGIQKPETRKKRELSTRREVRNTNPHRPEPEPDKESRRPPQTKRNTKKKERHKSRPGAAALGLIFVLLSLAGMAWGLMNLQSDDASKQDTAVREQVELNLTGAVEAKLDEMKDRILNTQDTEP